MIKFYLAICLLFIQFAAICQEHIDTVHLKNKGPYAKIIVTDRPPQAIYFQLGGSAPVFSLNYDRRFKKSLNGLGFSAGIGYYGQSGLSIFSVPVSLNYLIGKQYHFFEIAAGATYLSSHDDGTFGFFSSDQPTSGSLIFYHINVGYRYQPTIGGFFFRGGISPLFVSGTYGTSFYLGFGHNF